MTLTQNYTSLVGPAKDIRPTTSFTWTSPAIYEADVTHAADLLVQARGTNYSRTWQFSSNAVVSWDLQLNIAPQPDGSTTTRNVNIYQYTKRTSDTNAWAALCPPPPVAQISSTMASVSQNVAPFASPLNLTSYSYADGVTGPLTFGDPQADAVESSGYSVVPVTFTCLGGVWYGTATMVDATYMPELELQVYGTPGPGYNVGTAGAGRVTRYVVEH